MDNDVVDRLQKGVKDMETLFLGSIPPIFSWIIYLVDTFNRAQKENKRRLAEAERNNESSTLKGLFHDQEKMEKEIKAFKKVHENLLQELQQLADEGNGTLKPNHVPLIEKFFIDALGSVQSQKTL
jgi:hypothetical protein